MHTCDTCTCSIHWRVSINCDQRVSNNKRPQIAWAGQQEGKKRVRRSVIGISVGPQIPNAGDRVPRAPVMPPVADVHDVYTPNNSEPDYHDPLFPRQWHFVCVVPESVMGLGVWFLVVADGLIETPSWILYSNLSGLAWSCAHTHMCVLACV